MTVGATGFPASGIMGTGLEIALAPADAFGFLMREILDKIDAYSPFFGYVSIRVCSMTNTLMGMQQFGDAKNPYSVMIEVVASRLRTAWRSSTDFRVVSEDCTPNPLQPGGKCAVTVVAGPGSMGARDAELAVSANVPADSVALHALGLDVHVEWSAALLDFGPWKVGQTSQRQDVSIHNTGNATIDVTQIDFTGDFKVQDVVPQYMSIPPDGYKYFWVWFTPTATGAQQGCTAGLHHTSDQRPGDPPRPSIDGDRCLAASVPLPLLQRG